jgi:vacuolar-type H+-ATPase subunit H
MKKTPMKRMLEARIKARRDIGRAQLEAHQVSRAAYSKVEDVADKARGTEGVVVDQAKERIGKILSRLAGRDNGFIEFYTTISDGHCVLGVDLYRNNLDLMDKAHELMRRTGADEVSFQVTLKMAQVKGMGGA